jgi:hypothetical protein
MPGSVCGLVGALAAIVLMATVVAVATASVVFSQVAARHTGKWPRGHLRIFLCATEPRGLGHARLRESSDGTLVDRGFSFGVSTALGCQWAVPGAGQFTSQLPRRLMRRTELPESSPGFKLTAASDSRS